MEKTIALLFALACWAKTSAQAPAEIARLDSLLKTEMPDTTRAFKLGLLCYYLADISPDTARMHGLEGLALAQKTGHERTLGACESNLGWLEFRQGHYSEAKRLMQAAAGRFRSAGATKGLMSVLHNLGNFFMNESDFPQAFRCFEEYFNLAEKSGAPLLAGRANNNFGRLYKGQGNLAEAEKYFRGALKKFEEVGRADLASDALCNIGNLRFEKEEFGSALDLYQKALETGGNAISQHQISLICENTGITLGKMRRFDEAFVWLEKAKGIYEKLNARNELTNLGLSIGEAYQQMGEPLRAKIELERALHMAAENGFADIELNILDALQNLAVASGDYRAAYLSSQRAAALRDSLHQTDRDRELMLLQTQFETTQKEKEIQTKTLETERLRWLVALGGLALALVTMMAAWLWQRARHRRRSNEQLVAKNLEIEAARARAEHSEAVKKQFLANMSHEIRTPLNALVGISNLLAARPVADEATARYHQILQKSSENLLAIVNDILDYSKLEAGKLQPRPAPFCLADLLKHTADMFAEKAAEKGIALETDFAPGLPRWVSGDMHYLTQVLNNLLSNAMKFTENGGRVTVAANRGAAENGDTGTLSVHRPPSAAYRFSVSDTGIGIAPENLPQVFESFGQVGAARQHGGTGLGLAISREIVTLMGGHLEAQSSLGKGSKFSFEIELPEIGTSDNQSLLLDIGPMPRLHLAAPLRVLLAEDNAYNQIVATDSLAQLSPNFRVSTAADGHEALAFLEKNDCDLLLLDLRMPGMDGFQLARLLREHPLARLRTLPIIALTASVVGAEIEMCQSSGMDGYVPKPFRLSHFADEIVRVLPEKAAVLLPDQPVPQPAAPAVTDLSAFEKLTADLPGQHDRMLRLLLEGFAEKTAPLETAIGIGDRAAFAKIVHALRPLTLSAGMAAAQNSMTLLETNWEAMLAADWEAQAKTFAAQIGQAVTELHNAL